MGNTPDKVQLTIKTEERLSPDMIGIELGVKVLDQSSKPVSGQPFKVHADAEILIEGITNEQGEYNGQRVLTVREGTQRKVFLVLEGSAATDWKVIGGQKQEEGPAPDVAETPYVFGARMKDFTTTIKLPAHSLKFDEDHFINLLAGHTSLKKWEKKKVIESIPTLRQEQVDKLIRIFDKERTQLLELPPKYSVQLKKLEDECAADWRELEVEYEAADTEDTFEEILNGNRTIGKEKNLSLKKGTYQVTGTIGVEKGGSLVIEPGTILEFKKGTGIVCEGKLTAIGSKEEPIIFKNPEGLWDNITLCGSGTFGSHLEYCIIEGGQGRNFHESKGRTNILSRPKRVEDDNSYGGGLLLLSIDPVDLTFPRADISSPSERGGVTLRSLIIRSNSAKKGGGGIHCHKSSPLVHACRIENNGSGWGGGISIQEAKPDIKSSGISYNTAVHGGGMYVSESEVIMEDCSVDNNCANGISGGGIDCSASVMRIVSSRITKNKSRGDDVRGAGIEFADGSEAEIVDSQITENESDGTAGAIYLHESKLTITGSKINKNRAKRMILQCFRSKLSIVNSEIAFNTCSRDVIWCRKHRLEITGSGIKGNYVGELPILDIKETDYTVVDSEIQEK